MTLDSAIVRTTSMRLSWCASSLNGIGVEHHLAAASAEGLRYGGAGDAGELIADDVLRDVFELGFGQTFAAEGQQADGQAGRIELQNDRGQSAGRQAAHFRGCEAADHGDRRIGIRARMEEDFDDADAGERARLDVFDAAAERQETFQAKGDAVFDLLGRHARIEGGDDDDRNVDGGEHVHGHARQADGAQNRDDEAGDYDEVGCPDSESRHVGRLAIGLHQLGFDFVAGVQAGAPSGNDEVGLRRGRRRSRRGAQSSTPSCTGTIRTDARVVDREDAGGVPLRSRPSNGAVKMPSRCFCLQR